MVRVRVGLVLVVLALALLGAGAAVQRDLARPRSLKDTDYVSAAQCARCHPDHVRSFARTFHRTMTQAASEQSVAGDFRARTLDYFGVRAELTRGPQGEFIVQYAPPGGERERFVVVKTVGSRRYQQYLAQRGDALVRLPVAYHLEEQRWFHMNGAFLTPDPELPLTRADYERHVTRWNDNCVFCHNVAPNPGKRPGAHGEPHFDTQVAELGIACEACHGPGAEHVAENHDPLRRYALHLSSRADPSIVNPARLPKARALDVCGRCHGQRITDDVERFLRSGDPFVPGEDLALYSAPLWRDTTLHGEPAFAARFWADGSPRLTAYEYQGVLLSACAQRGELTCLSCHGMHEGDPRGQLRPSRRGAAMCTSCHPAFESEGAQAAHARHPPGPELPSCVDCHMPKLVYGVLDAHVSHRIERPSAARAAKAERPDACTQCHIDRTRDWAVHEERRLWGTTPAHDRVTPPAEAISEVERQLFAGDPIARALAADALGRARSRAARARRVALLLDVMERDPYPAIRHFALRSARRLLEGDPTLERFVPEIPAAQRSAQLEPLRSRFSLPPQLDARIQALRAQSRHLDIEIGE